MEISIDLSYYENDQDFMYDMIRREEIVRQELYFLLVDYYDEENDALKSFFENDYPKKPNSKTTEALIDLIIEHNLESDFIDIIENNYSNFSGDTILYIMTIVLSDSERDSIVKY